MAALLCLLSGVAQAALAVPPLAQRVTDQVGLLDASQHAALEQKLVAFESRKGAQLAVLIVATTAPETIEQYSIRVAEQWKLGRKGVDDGVLLLLARDDRAVRIEVGYGLEGVIPDAIANRLTDDFMVPHFRDGDFYGGIDAGVSQLIALIDGEPLPPPKPAGTSAPERGSALLPLLIFGLFIAQGMRRLLGRGLGALAAGGGMFVLAWLLSGALLVALFFALVAAVLTLFGFNPGFGGGWSSRGGGGFGGGFGGGGFGGGGGGFGGGGASGRW